MPIVLLETLLASPHEQRNLSIENPQDIITTQDPSGVAECLRQVEHAVAGGAIAAGFVSYEAGYSFLPNMPEIRSLSMPLVWFAIATHFSNQLPAWLQETGDASVENLSVDTNMDEYGAAIETIRNHIERGNTYQVNYTIRYNGKLSGSARSLYRQLRVKQPVPYAAYIETDDWSILSLSPELFFRKQESKIMMRPMKGTSPRGRTTEEDRELTQQLSGSPKERAENLMIVDLLRNDLGRICIPGSIQVTKPLQVERYDTVLQMTSEIEGRARSNLNLPELFSALFPSGSVTGAPKIRTMQLIHQLEKSPRLVYTGAIGFVSQQESVFSVAIRTALVKNGLLQMGIGSGILHEADAHREYEECILKGRFLTDQIVDFELLETMLWLPGSGFQRLPLHIDRLTDSAEYFGIPVTRIQLIEYLKQNEPSVATPARVRLLVNRSGLISISMTPVGELPSSFVRWAESTVHTSNRFLYHKTTNRAQYQQELERANAEGFVEVFFRNESGEVTEGAFSNIWILKDGVYYTPPVKCGLLSGTFRRSLLSDQNFQSQERVLYEQDLLEADAIFISNAVRGLVRVEFKP